jgi:hypothetical protein
LLSSLVVSPASDAKTARLVDRCSQFTHTVNEGIEDGQGINITMGKLLGPVHDCEYSPRDPLLPFEPYDEQAERELSQEGTRPGSRQR